MNMVWSIRVCLVALMSVGLVMVGFPRAGLAAGTDLSQWRITELENQVRTLTQRIQMLESQVLSQVRDLTRRVEALERHEIRPKLETIPQPGVSGSWRDQENWRKLHEGMTAEEVRGLLGKPDYVDIGTGLVHWGYGSRERGPQVVFEAGSMTVERWTQPR